MHADLDYIRMTREDRMRIAILVNSIEQDQASPLWLRHVANAAADRAFDIDPGDAHGKLYALVLSIDWHHHDDGRLPPQAAAEFARRLEELCDAHAPYEMLSENSKEKLLVLVHLFSSLMNMKRLTDGISGKRVQQSSASTEIYSSAIQTAPLHKSSV